MNQDIALLIQLQEKDSAILSIEKEAASKDPLIKKKKSDIETHKSLLAENKKGLQTALVKKKELENEAASKEAAIVKHQGELNSVKTNDAYKALLAEIETAKAGLSAVEDAELELFEKIESLEKEVVAKDKTAKEEEAQMSVQLTALEKDKAALLEKAESLKKERDEFAKGVPSGLLQKYETIRQRREGVAIAPVNKSSCGGCRMSMSPGKVAEVQGGKALCVCENCNRLLYIPEPQEKEPAPSTPPTA